MTLIGMIYMIYGLSACQRPVVFIAYCVLRIAYCVLRIAYCVLHKT